MTPATDFASPLAPEPEPPFAVILTAFSVSVLHHLLDHLGTPEARIPPDQILRTVQVGKRFLEATRDVIDVLGGKAPPPIPAPGADPSTTIVVVGPPQSGKTSFATALRAAGAAFVRDDYPGAPGLSPDATTYLADVPSSHVLVALVRRKGEVIGCLPWGWTRSAYPVYVPWVGGPEALSTAMADAVKALLSGGR